MPGAGAARHAGGMRAPTPIFGPACATALLAGVTGCLLLPGLPPYWLLALALLAGMAVVARGRRWRPLGALLFGIGFAGLHAGIALDRSEERRVGKEGRARGASTRGQQNAAESEA